MASINRNHEEPTDEGRRQSHSLRYWITTDNDNRYEALGMLAAEAPASDDGKVRDRLSVDRLGPNEWTGEATYIVSRSRLSFEISSQNVRVNQSLQTISSTPRPGFVAPNFQGLINVSENGVAGVDVPVATAAWSETHVFERLAITQAYQLTLESLVGKQNDAPFRGRNVGEVIFDGASGTLNDFWQWEITYRFISSRNAVNIPVGPITVASKLGWDYLWVYYTPQYDASSFTVLQRPHAAYVERVIPFGDFNLLGINPII